MTPEKQHLLDRAGRLHVWVHCVCDSMHNTCASPSQIKSQHGEGRWEWKLTPQPGSYWKPIAARRGRKVSPTSIVPGKSTTPQWKATHAKRTWTTQVVLNHSLKYFFLMTQSWMSRKGNIDLGGVQRVLKMIKMYTKIIYISICHGKFQVSWNSSYR